MRTNWTRILAGLVTVVIAGACGAAMKREKDMTLEQLTKSSDAVVIGKCVDKQVRWVRRHIETDYEVVVEETLKGGKEFSPGMKFRMTVMGGESQEPPITQYTELQPHMFSGENVALFLKTDQIGTPQARAKAVADGSNLLTTPRAVGMNQGKFSVVTDETDGKRKLTRVNLENYGFMPQDMVLQRVLKAVARREVGVTTGTVVELGGGLVTSPEGKAMLDAAVQNDPQAAAALKRVVSRGPDAADADAVAKSVLPTVRRGSGIVLQDLDEFKTQVKQFVD